MKKKTLWGIFLLSLLGMVVSLLSTQHYYRIAESGFEFKSFCNVNAYINCDTAYASKYAAFMGIPVSALGFLFYLWMIVATFIVLKSEKFSRGVAGFAWGMALVAFAVSIYKAYILFFVLKVLCLLCVTSHIVNFLLFLLWHIFLGIGFLRRKSIIPPLKEKIVPVGLLTLLLFGIGWAALSGYSERKSLGSKLNVPVEEVVRYHYKQSAYAFEPDGSAPVWGNPEAKVTIVDFSDFQCPHCKNAAFHLKPMLTAYKDKIRFLYYHYPLDSECNAKIQGGFHKVSCAAAYAAVCAQTRGDFWSYHEDIFRNQKNLSRELLLTLAEERGWDTTEFASCMASSETKAKVQADIAAGEKIYVTGTPLILVNNRQVKYWSIPEIFRAVVEEEIRRSE